MEDKLLQSLEFRLIGPHRAGRVVTVSGDPNDRGTFYFGACAGGVWKTTSGGSHWENVTDGFFKTSAVGAIAVAHSDPNVIYVGTGEAAIRSNVSHGDGVYKSTDGGASWTNMGLAETRHIGRHRRPPDESRHRLCRGLRPRLGTERGTRRLSHERRRQDLGEGPLQEREGRCHRRLTGSHQPAHPLRRHLGGAALPVHARQRRR